MKIMLTGANGLVGQKIKAELAGNREVELLATSLHPEVNPLEYAYQFETLDITMPSQTVECIERFNPDVIINSAAQANVNRCEQEKAECRQINTEAVMDLTRLVDRYEVHLIQLSTDFVFEGHRTDYSEDDTARPVNYYGLAKKEAEEYIMQNARNWSIIRTVLVYGYVPGLNRHNLVTWVYESLKNGRSIRVVSDQIRMPTLGEDLARACSRIALQKATGIFHISGREVMSIEEMAKKTARHFRLNEELITPVTSSELSEPARRPPKTGFNLLHAEQTIGYVPHSFQEGLNLIEQQIDKKNHTG